MITEISRQLESYYQQHPSTLKNVSISYLTKIAAGWESEIFAFTLGHARAGDWIREELVLRRYPGDGAGEKAAREYHAIARLGAAGYPVPKVYSLETENAPIGTPFIIMERLYGGNMWGAIDRADAETTPRLLTTFGGLVARLHRLDGRAFVDPDDRTRIENPYVFYDQWMEMVRRAHEHHPHSGLRPVVDWLTARRPSFACPRPSPTHNDFHPGNVIWQPDDSPVVIDWTGFQVSDPRFDLGWTLLLIYAYTGPNARDLVLEGYTQVLGHAVEALDCFEVFACMRRLYDLSATMVHGAEKQGLHPDAAADMRRQKPAYERVYELLLQRTGTRIAEVESLLASL